jgi:hypothetical protein
MKCRYENCDNEITTWDMIRGGGCQSCRDFIANEKIEKVTDWRDWKTAEKIEAQAEKNLLQKLFGAKNEQG